MVTLFTAHCKVQPLVGEGAAYVHTDHAALLRCNTWLSLALMVTLITLHAAQVQHVVGEGAYGLVMKCKVHGSDPPRFVAVKEFKISVSGTRCLLESSMSQRTASSASLSTEKECVLY